MKVLEQAVNCSFVATRRSGGDDVVPRVREVPSCTVWSPIYGHRVRRSMHNNLSTFITQTLRAPMDRRL